MPLLQHQPHLLVQRQAAVTRGQLRHVVAAGRNVGGHGGRVGQANPVDGVEKVAVAVGKGRGQLRLAHAAHPRHRRLHEHRLHTIGPILAHDQPGQRQQIVLAPGEERVGGVGHVRPR